MIGRRALLGGLAALAAQLPARATADDAALKAALDGLAAIPRMEDRLASLASFDPAKLSPASRADLLTVRPALAIDIRLGALFPGKVETPFRPPSPKGAEAYRLLLERHLGGATDPEATHRRFEREASRFAARADALLRGLGFARGTTGERFRAIFHDPRWHYPDGDAGRDQAVADMNRWLDAARARLPALIGPLPPECLDVSARRMSRADEAAAKGGYRDLPAPSRSGAYYVDLHDLARRPSWSLKSVVHHELLPGHMAQLPVEARARPHPLRLAYLPAYAEGWAIRAEQLMADHRAFARDPAGELGYVHWMLFRIGRGLADTGIHHRDWTLAEARRRLDELQGEPAYFAPFDTDLQRIAAEPAIRAAEAMTWLMLADLPVRPALVNGRLPKSLLSAKAHG